MNLKDIILKTLTLVLVVTGLLLLHKGTLSPPYKEFSPTFVQRGLIDQAMEDYSPKNASDSAVMNRMMELQFIDEVRSNLQESKPDYNMIIASVGSFLLALTALWKIVNDSLNKKSDKRFETLSDIVISHHKERQEFEKVNTVQHEKIFDRLLLVDDRVLRDSVTEALKAVARKHIHYNKQFCSAEMQMLIDGQTERVIQLSEEIITTQFTFEMLSVAEAKMETQKRASWKQVVELFGCDYLVRYKVGQAKAIEEFYSRLNVLAKEGVVNSRYDRYRASAELFLHDLIGMAITEYENFKIKTHEA
ncbi:hypothetical protein JZU46_06780 [bacterium]|jgi:hypothetical protein|nr:hypothetical protein [bacterium]